MFSFIHCADLHLDSPLKGLNEKKAAPEEQIRLAARSALMNLVELAISKKVDFVIVAGDVFDGDWKDYHTGLFYNAQMARLDAHQIKVFQIRGNHDAASNITLSLTLPPNVFEFSATESHTETIEGLKVAIHGQSYGRREVFENIALNYPHALDGYFNIGILHTCAEGQEGHDSYAPCKVSDLIKKRYQYWALGHIHKRMLLNESPPILFPGNIQGRHIKETGAKGCTLVSVNGDDIQLEHHDLDVLRWYECIVDLTDIHEKRDFSQQVSLHLSTLVRENPNHFLAVRIRLEGATELHGVFLADLDACYAEVENAANLVKVDQIWIEKIVVKTKTPITLEQRLMADPALGDLLRMVRELESDSEFLSGLQAELQAALKKMPDLAAQHALSHYFTADAVQARFQSAEAMLIHLILQGGAPK